MLRWDRLAAALLAAALAALLVACEGEDDAVPSLVSTPPAPTGSPAASATPAPSPSPTSPAQAAAGASPTPSAPSVVSTPPPRATATPAPAPSPAATSSPSPSAIASPSPSPTATPSPEATPSATATPSSTATPSPVPTATPSPTSSPTPSAEATPSATASPSPTASATAAATPEDASTPAAAAVSLAAAFGGREFERPIELAAYPAGPDAGGVLVAEQDGRVYVLHEDGEALLLDLRPRVSRASDEEGLLSVAVDPRFEANGRLWLYYSVDRSAAPGPRRTRLSRFTVDAGNPLAVDAGSELVVLEVEQPYSNHNGGAIRFGPDGLLYLGLGDGGSAGDPRGNGQNLGTLLGSIIRIDVRESSAAEPYRIPPDNPFVGATGARGEIWAYGLRNPWRMAFDGAGRLWVGDVGQNALEEIDVVERGGNYGWDRLEGTRCFEPRSGCERAGMTPPIAEYGRSLGCSVTGGVVYEGEDVPAIAGSYLFADYCSGRLWALAPGSGEIVEVARSSGRVASFGTDARGEVYLLTFGGPILRIAAADGR